MIKSEIEKYFNFLRFRCPGLDRLHVAHFPFVTIFGKKISLRFKNRLRRLSLLISRPIFKQLCFLFSASKEMFVQTMSRVSTFSKFSTLSICSKVLPREQSRNQLRRGMMWVTSHGGRVFNPYPNTPGLNLGSADNCDWTHWALKHELESRNFGLYRKQEPSWFLRLEL